MRSPPDDWLSGVDTHKFKIGSEFIGKDLLCNRIMRARKIPKLDHVPLGHLRFAVLPSEDRLETAAHFGCEFLYAELQFGSEMRDCPGNIFGGWCFSHPHH